jgi:hypothetical protein
MSVNVAEALSYRIRILSDMNSQSADHCVKTIAKFKK